MSSTRTLYPSDVSDDEWTSVASYVTLLPEDVSQRKHELREVWEWAALSGEDGRPLALGFHAQVCVHLTEGHLELPAQKEPGDDRERVSCHIGAEHGLHGELSARVVNERPADGDWR